MLSPRCFDGVWYVQWSVIRSCLVLQVVGSWGRSQGYNGCIVACQPLVVYCSCMSLGVISSHFFMSRHVTHCLRALSSAGDHWLLRNPPIGWPTSPRRTRTCSIHGGLIYIYIQVSAVYLGCYRSIQRTLKLFKLVGGKDCFSHA